MMRTDWSSKKLDGEQSGGPGVTEMCGVQAGAAQRLGEGGLIPGSQRSRRLPLCVGRDMLVWSEPIPRSPVAMVMAVPLPVLRQMILLPACPDMAGTPELN